MYKLFHENRLDNIKIAYPNNNTLALAVLFLVCLTFIPTKAISRFLFEEVTETAGISHSSPSFGASWGDFNGDNKPDIWVSNHYSAPSLYVNNGDGTFVDVTATVWVPLGILDVADTHGAAWADFDNDGDQDLLELSGGNGGGAIFPGQYNHMFVNTGGGFVEKAEEMGLLEPLSRSRTPTWFDWNNDGLLDVVLTAWLRGDGQGGPGIFTQVNGVFVNDNAITGVTIDDHTPFAHLADITGDSTLDLIFHSNLYPLKIYDIASAPFAEVTTSVAPTSLFVSDVATADFSGDQKVGFFLARRGDPSGVAQVSDNQIKGRIRISGKEHGLNFKTLSEVNFDIYLEWIGIDRIYVGSSGTNPESSNFSLSSVDPQTHGILPHISGTDIGVYIGFNNVTSEWEFRVSSNNINFYINTTDLITDLSEVGFSSTQKPGQAKLWRINNGVFEDQTLAAGLNVSLPCRTVTSGDFDNDMDIDLYMVCTNPYGNLPNVAFENMGDGTFSQVLNAAGAEGSSLGRGENVVTADYDGDGFLDLFITNGLGPAPFYNGPHQLFRNIGNSNHWLQIDLEGVTTNRDGIGAKVYLSSGGVTQYREQAGGIHLVSQNFKRLHFGLGQNTVVDKIVVEWPSGIKQEILDVPVDQVIRIIESSDRFIAGTPSFTAGFETGVFIWKDTFDGEYHLRTVGQGIQTEFEINLVTTKPLINAQLVKSEPSDSLQLHPYGFSMHSTLSSWQDGLDFAISPGATALISVTQNGASNPRQLYAGKERARLAPVGWVLPVGDYPVRPQYQAGQVLGLYLGRKVLDNTFQFSWNGDGKKHQVTATILSSSDFSSVNPLYMETNDIVTQGGNWVDLSLKMANGADVLSLLPDSGSLLGFMNLQDGLFMPESVNPANNNLPTTNAYKLPVMTPYDMPIFDPLANAGVYLWKSSDDSWHLRLTAGGNFQRVTGMIQSSRPIVSVAPYRLEVDDVVDNGMSTQIIFNLGASAGWQDGIDFVVADNATLTIDFQSSTSEAVDLLYVGKNKWPVSALPVDLTGW